MTTDQPPEQATTEHPSPANAPPFLQTVGDIAELAQQAIDSLRLSARSREPRLEEIVPLGPLEQAGFSYSHLQEILGAYFTQVRLASELPLLSQRKFSKDPVTKNASEWAGDVVVWEREVYTPRRRHIDGLIEGLLQEAPAAQAQLEGAAGRIARVVHTLYGEPGSSEDPAVGLHLNGALTAPIRTFQKQLYEVYCPKRDDPELLFKLSFQALVQSRGWEKLDDAELAVKLGEEQVPLPLFAEYTGRKIISKKPETIAEVIEGVQRRSQPGVSVVNGGDYVRLENIACTTADEQVFESYPVLYVKKSVEKDAQGNILFFTAYQAALYASQPGCFAPSMALSCNILAAFYSGRRWKGRLMAAIAPKMQNWKASCSSIKTKGMAMAAIV